MGHKVLGLVRTGLGICSWAMLALGPSSCAKGGCHEGPDFSSQVVVESSSFGDRPSGRCEVKGTVFNGGDRELLIEIAFDAFDSTGRRIGDVLAFPEPGPTPAGSRATYSALVFDTVCCALPSCSQVAGIRLTRVKATERGCPPGVGVP